MFNINTYKSITLCACTFQLHMNKFQLIMQQIMTIIKISFVLTNYFLTTDSGGGLKILGVNSTREVTGRRILVI